MTAKVVAYSLAAPFISTSVRYGRVVLQISQKLGFSQPHRICITERISITEEFKVTRGEVAAKELCQLIFIIEVDF